MDGQTVVAVQTVERIRWGDGTEGMCRPTWTAEKGRPTPVKTVRSSHGTPLARLRVTAGTPLGQVAAALGLTPIAFVHWETGRVRMPARWAPELAELWDCTPADVLTAAEATWRVGESA